MSVNPDHSKQAKEATFSCKLQKISHPPIYFNNNPIKQVSPQKHLRMILDTKLTVQEHIKNTLSKANKTIGLLWKVQNNLPQTSTFIIYTRNTS